MEPLNLNQANVLLNEACRLFYAQAHRIQTDVVIIGISPGKACIILMISHSAILGVLYKLLSFLIRKALLLLNILDASLQIAAQENRNQVFALTEDIVSATADDDMTSVCGEPPLADRVLR